MRLKKNCAVTLVSLLLTLPAFASAADDNAFKFSGYIDGSYNYLVQSNQFISGVPNRVFDLQENGFTLQQAATTIAWQPPQGFGGLLNLIAGRDANTIAAYGWNPYFGSQTLAIDWTQAYLQYAYQSFTVIGGRFVTLAGAEVLDPTLDLNFSRSILNGYAEPFTHLGFRGTYAANCKLNLIAGINNGWDNIRDTSRQKTIELGVTYIFNPTFTLAMSGYRGGQRATDRVATGPTGIRSLIDLVATVNATDALTFIANIDWGVQSKAALPNGEDARAVWEGIAAYVNYKFNQTWRTTLRGEAFYDEDGYRTGVRQNWRELTLTLAYMPIKCIEIRAETRRDFSNVDSFLDDNGVSVHNNQQSFAVEAFYKFA